MRVLTQREPAPDLEEKFNPADYPPDDGEDELDGEELAIADFINADVRVELRTGGELYGEILSVVGARVKVRAWGVAEPLTLTMGRLAGFELSEVRTWGEVLAIRQRQRARYGGSPRR